MIKAEELRIGNWVSNIHTNEDYQLTPQRWINLLRHFYPKDDCGVSMCYIKPIPLTEEWLIKLGFTQHTEKTQDFYIDDDGYSYWNICYGTDNQWWFHAGLGNGDVPIANPQYVHQLQNLYYALTGTELEIK